MEKHEEDLVLQKQKVKHLMYDHQTNLSETKADHMVALKMAQDEHVLQENELLNDKKDAKRILKEMELAHENDLRALKLVGNNVIFIVQNNFNLINKLVIINYDISNHF